MSLKAESRLRSVVAARVRFCLPTFAAAGLLSEAQALAFSGLSRPAEVEVQECRWVRFGSEKGEIDILLPQVGIAIECKVGPGECGRTNWEEALGQALRDKQLPFCRHAYIAVPAASASSWMMSTTSAAGIGVIQVQPSELTFRAVRFSSHPRKMP